MSLTGQETMDGVTVRQSLPTILAALLPQNLVRVQWKPHGTDGRGLAQVTGTVAGVLHDVVRIHAAQRQGGLQRGSAIHVDRIHSVVVLREGENARVLRAQAADHLRHAAFHLAGGDTDAARTQLAHAGGIFPGLLPAPTIED